MASEHSDPTANLDTPEGYTVEPLQDGRLVVYEASTGTWLGHFSPALSNVQELAEELINVHEEEEKRKEILSDLLVDPPLPGEAAGDQDEAALRIPERELMTPTEDAAAVWGSTDTARADTLRIRELEIVAGLAVEALVGAGDEASAEVVRQVLEKDSR